MSLGALGYVGYGLETTEGVFVTPTKFLPVTSFSFEDTNDYIVPDQIRNTRDRSVAMAAPYMTSGSMELELIPNDISQLLKSAFAASVNTSAYSGGGYQHAMTPGDTSPTFTFESNAADILIMRYGGIRVNTLEIKSAFGEIVTSTWGLDGTTRQKQGSETSQTYTDILPFHFTGTDVFVAAAQNVMVKDFTFSVGNNLDRIGTLRKTRSWRRTALGMRDTNLAMTLDFTDTAEYDRFLSETEFVVKLHLQSDSAGLPNMGTNKPILEITLNRVRWNKVGVPLTAGDFLEQAVEAMVLKPMVTGNVFDAKLINGETTVP